VISGHVDSGCKLWLTKNEKMSSNSSNSNSTGEGPAAAGTGPVGGPTSGPTSGPSGGPNGGQMNPVQALMAEIEARKKRADELFAAHSYDEAGGTYTAALELLAKVRGSIVGEAPALHCMSQQVECCIALEKYEQASVISHLVLTMVPSIINNVPVWIKVLLNKATALEKIGKLEEALKALDEAIGIAGIGAPTMKERRETLTDSIRSKNDSFVIPPVPQPLSTAAVEGALSHILSGIASFAHNKPEDTTIELLVNDNFVPTLRTLITNSHGGNVDARDSKQNNLMWCVCKAAMMVGELKVADADVVLPLLQVLLEHGARAEQRYAHQDHRTPLQMFAIAGAVECARTLIEAGASVHTYDSQGWTPLVVACAPNGPVSGRNAKVVELLLNGQYTTSSGQLVTVKPSKSHTQQQTKDEDKAIKSNPNHSTAQGLSPLQLAVQCNDLVSARLLLAAGASITHRDGMGFSPIVWAHIGSQGKDPSSAKNSEDCVKFLLAAASFRGAQTFNECDQDTRCFQFTKVLASLRETFLKQQADAQTSTNTQQANDLALLTKLLAALPIETSPSPSSSSAGAQSAQRSMLEKVHDALTQSMPNVFTKVWKLPAVDTPEQAAQVQEQMKSLTSQQLMNVIVAMSPPSDRAQLRIMMTGPFGPGGRPDKPAFLVPYNEIVGANPSSGGDAGSTGASGAAFVSGLYRDYKELIVNLLANRYSAAIPSNKALQFIVQQVRQYSSGSADHLLTQLVSEPEPTDGSEIEFKGYWADLLADIKSDSEAPIDCQFHNMTTDALDESVLSGDVLIIAPDLLLSAKKDAASAVVAKDKFAAAVSSIQASVLASKTKGLVICVGECPSNEVFAHLNTSAAADDDDEEMPDLVDGVEAVHLAGSSATTSGELKTPFKHQAGDVFDSLLFKLNDKYEIKARHELPNWLHEKTEVTIWAPRE
jgi:hypothetical protein